MKNIFSLVLILFCVQAQSAVWTVDNNLDSGAQFSSLGSAQSAASPGDTLLVQPSGYSYGDLSLIKRLVIIGPGHHPEFSGGMPAEMGILAIANGSDSSVVEGMRINGVNGALWNAASNLTFRNNRIQSSAAISSNYGDGSNSDNWVFEGNVIIDPGSCGGCVLININTSAGQSDNWVFRNNVIYTPSNGNQTFSNVNSTASFVNNIIIYTGSNGMFTGSSFALFENNIFWSTSAETDFVSDCSSCEFNKNLFYNPNTTLDEVEGDNIVNQNPMFVDQPTTWGYEKNINVEDGSPADNAGSDGTDLGVHGGSFNFRNEGYPDDHPRLTYTTPQFITVPQNATFNVDFGAKRAGL